MKRAPIPTNEKERLLSLHALGLLDTQPEERFDRITRTATKIFRVPISTLTLVDAKREWFKSCQGLSEREGDRAISFCGHALLTEDVFVIPDTKKDERFADNPMVIGKPYIRFYAGVPIVNADGQRVGVFCIKDTKPRKFSKANEEILKNLSAWAELEVNSRNLSMALAEQKKLGAAKSEFISLASHQLRTPPTSMKWFLEMLLSGDVGALNEKQREYAEEVSRANQRMIALVNTLLNVSRIELGSFVVAPEPTNVVDLVKEILEEYAHQIQAKKLDVAETHARNLPTLSVDPKILGIVIHNLISNAVKYTPEKGKIRVEISFAKKSGLTIAVSDTGCGIPKNQQDKIFTKFFRADNVRGKDTDGTGLGLYLAKSIVDHAKGSLRFESEPNRGTTFTLAIPARIVS